MRSKRLLVWSDPALPGVSPFAEQLDEDLRGLYSIGQGECGSRDESVVS